MNVNASQNWTDSAQGTALNFNTTTNGTVIPATRMTIDNVGNVGIGTLTPLDRLQVDGDIRVGTSGTNGCLKDFGGSGLIGTCASDRRFKQQIRPFGPALASVAALQPVHYFWRSTEFPDRHFGDTRAYGLIAQEVEQILPDLVVTGADGYKAVNYSKLPLLTIQAVKELKVQNDALSGRNATLEQRVAELERLVAELAAAARSRN
jgi:hypothetical protein